jgi:hypothetical protein
MITAKEIMGKIDEALKMFGEYTYGDKGANEVMDIAEISNSLKDMTAFDIVSLLEEVEEKSSFSTRPFLQAIISSLADWDDPKADILFESELFNKYY